MIITLMVEDSQIKSVLLDGVPVDGVAAMLVSAGEALSGAVATPTTVARMKELFSTMQSAQKDLFDAALAGAIADVLQMKEDADAKSTIFETEDSSPIPRIDRICRNCGNNWGEHWGESCIPPDGSGR